MITVRLQGGLGNQLFQYAAALAVRRESAHTIWFVDGGNTHNKLGHDYVAELFVEGKRHDGEPPTPMASYKQYSAFEPWMPTWFVHEIVYLEGYFQSLPEIAPILPDLRASLLPRLPTTAIENSMLDTAFVHVRRGDYLLNPTYHWVQSIQYYEKGMSIIGAKRWLVFSDDIAWCREQACFQTEGVTLCDEPDELVALNLMSRCGAGAVISNSSFSWWGAMLGNMTRVVYPELWSEHHRPNLFPETWVRVSSSP
jgi:hypothetical protein